MKVYQRKATLEKEDGVYATREILKGDLVMVDQTKTISAAEYLQLSESQRNLSYQMGLDEVAIPINLKEPAETWFVNHSCNPNTERKAHGWIATRTIEKGEEITHDYAVLWFDTIEPFEINPCLCGSKNCRGKFSGNDWKIPELSKKYFDQFPPDFKILIFKHRTSQ